MTYYADLGAIDYFGDDLGPLRAIGWLGRGHDFARREVTAEFSDRLRVLLIDPWAPVLCMGPHRCDLCEESDLPVRGTRNVFVPGDGRIYVAPEMIRHYIGVHGYGPPEEFVRAVLRCPDTGSEAYFALCRANGAERLVDR